MKKNDNFGVIEYSVSVCFIALLMVGVAFLG